MSRQEERREAKRAYWRSVLADWARREGPAPESETATTGEKATATRAAPSFVTVQPEAEAAGSTGAAAERRPEPLRLTVGGATVEVPPEFCE